MRPLPILVAIICLSLCGCGLLDWAAGLQRNVNPDTGEETIERVAPPGGAPAEVLGRLLDPWIPWAGSALVAAAGLWVNIRKRKFAALATSAIDAVSEIKKQKDASGKVDLGELLRLLAAKQDANGVRQAARDMAKKAEAKL